MNYSQIDAFLALNEFRPPQPLIPQRKTGKPFEPKSKWFTTRVEYKSTFPLTYHSEDYTAIRTQQPFAKVAGSDLANARMNLYNGNISAMMTHLGAEHFPTDMSDAVPGMLGTFATRKLPTTDNGEVTGFMAHVTSLSDYYPFGSALTGRMVDDNYRYGFNGMEREGEIHNPGSAYDFGARMYDGRLGRFLSVDPAFSSQPYFTPYSFASNKPILFIDLFGLRGWPTTQKWGITDLERFGEFVNSEIKVIRSQALQEGLEENSREMCIVTEHPEVCFDCADFALTLYIRYAIENGKEVEVTLVDGQIINSSTTDMIIIAGATFSIDSPEDFLAIANNWSNALSLVDNMTSVNENEVKAGDLMNNGSHMQVISSEQRNSNGGYATFQSSGGRNQQTGKLEGRVPHDSNSSGFGSKSYKRWSPIAENSTPSSQISFGTEVVLPTNSQNSSYDW